LMIMRKTKVLIIEDDANIQELIRYNLAKEGYQVISAIEGEDGLTKAQTEKPNLIILDLMLPGMDGLEICRLLKADSGTAGIPIIMVTAKGEESDVVAGLELGADDYMTKPFSPKVLVARIRACLRRNKQKSIDQSSVLELNNLSIHPGRHEVLIDGNPIDLTFTEFRLLHLLAGRPGWVFTRYQIVDAIKGEDYIVTDRTVDVQVVGLRKKLGDYGRYIETVRGIGYRFKDLA
jgi:two-component system alkaline phosphatase synthesis response regulator PhoP